MKILYFVLLSCQVLEFLKVIREISGECDFVFIGDYDFRKFMSENIVNKVLRLMGYDIIVEVCGYGFRVMVCSVLIELGKWLRDVVEWQMSY